MKIYGGVEVWLQYFFIRHWMEVSVQLHVLAALLPGKPTRVPNGQEAGWAPEPVWTLCVRENLVSAGNRNPAQLRA
jgi:hypothetical protein